MFGLSLSSIKLMAIGLAALFVVGIIFAGYKFVTGLVNDLAVAKANVATLDAAKKVQDDTIAALQKNQAQMVQQVQANQASLDDLSAKHDASQATVDALAAELAKHDFNRIANARPTLLQRRLNSGTTDALRRLQRASGQRTEGVDGAGRPSQAPLIPPAPAGTAHP